MSSKDRFRLISAVYVVLRRDDEILLLRRANTGYHDGLYALPAGHIDGGEPALQAAIREVREEVGLTIDEADVKFGSVMHRVAEEGDHERVDFFFVTEKWQGEARNVEPHKADDVRWFKLSELPENMSPISRLAVENILAGIPYAHLNFGER